uniref:Uncharacterized protein n=1 Tax=Anguilla anguilla TaxID=7936 RepID=A0A0E9SFC5_ANGAN
MAVCQMLTYAIVWLFKMSLFEGICVGVPQ